MTDSPADDGDHVYDQDLDENSSLADLDHGQLVAQLAKWNRRLGQYKAHCLITVEEARTMPVSNLRKAVHATGDFLVAVIVNASEISKTTRRK